MATSMYITHLYDADKIYSQLQALQYTHNIGNEKRYKIVYYSDYVVLDLRPYIGDSSSAKHWTNLYEYAGYEIVEEREGLIRVLARGEDSPPVGYSEEYLEQFKETESTSENK
jgi:hypothetical protein